MERGREKEKLPLQTTLITQLETTEKEEQKEEGEVKGRATLHCSCINRVSMGLNTVQ